MNTIFITVYLLGFFALAGMTFAFFFRSMGEVFKEVNKPKQPYKVPAPHPEMEGVKYGEELLVFKKPELQDDE